MLVLKFSEVKSMKINIGIYINYFGPYHLAEKILFWKDPDSDAVDALGDRLSESFVGAFLSWIYSKQRRTNEIRIDKYDTWDMFSTLATIILPMLKQLKATKHGSPAVDDKDVPKHLRSTVTPATDTCDVDVLLHQRWDWVMDEMIWAFEQIVDADSDSQFFDHSTIPGTLDIEGWKAYNKRINNGTRLFGVYFRGLWD
jgi:hypothetical protein